MQGGLFSDTCLKRLHILQEGAYTLKGNLVQDTIVLHPCQEGEREKRKNLAKGLTKALLRGIIIWQHGRRYAGMAELADARDLKSREIFFSYRFDPGFRHHFLCTFCHQFNIAGQSSLVARRAHNPEVRRFKSPPRNQQKAYNFDCKPLFLPFLGLF